MQEEPVTFKGRARVPSPKISRPVQEVDRKTLGPQTKDLPPQYKLRRYYLPSEVAIHNSTDDCWVSLFNQVFDLTKLIAENYKSPLCDPLILQGGSNITHWFN